MADVTLFTAEDLTGFAKAMFLAAGMSDDHAALIAGDLVKANLRGVDSHGVSRIPMYLERLRRGLVNPRPNVTVDKVAGAVAMVDGDNGMGFVASDRAMNVACDLAGEMGIGMAGVRRSTHFGMGACYALRAIERGYISMIFTNSSPAIPMWGGRTTFLGASPIAAGIPGGAHPPFVMDMAMTVIARGKIRLAAMKGEPTPEDGYPGSYIDALALRVQAQRPDILSLPEEEQLIQARDIAYNLQLSDLQESLVKFNVHFDVFFSERTLHTAGEDGQPSLVDEAVDRLREQGHVFD